MTGKRDEMLEREYRRRRSNLILKCLIAAMILLCIGLGTWLIYELKFKEHKNRWESLAKKTQEDETGTNAAGSDGEEKEDASTDESALNGVEAEANRMAAQYDYDGAIEYLKSQPGYDRVERYKKLVVTYENTKASCSAYPLDQITHIFFHSLIWDTSKAFDGDEHEAGYNQVMTTASEMISILQQMYNRGYVMVSLHDMVEFSEDGTATTKEILLPPGKTPFVLSQDDCSYYHYMDGDGFAQKLIVTEDGKVKNTYVEDDGTVSVGDYDVVPIVDTFVEEHPDFSYHGHKGILALTGYEGVLGYRTDEVYKTRQADRITQYQQAFFDANPDFDFDKEVADAKAVADAMKAEGWEFASHTWGHINPLNFSLDGVKQDTERWKNWVAPVVGDTDVLIFAFGADISDWVPYSSENEYFVYYKSMGFNIFCNVDSSVKAWVQIGNDYLRQGRRNLDGYRMYYSPDLISDLFNVDQAWDKSRPTPVPEM